MGLLLVLASITYGANEPPPVSLKELIEVPQKYDMKLVAVQGFLAIYRPPHDISSALLYVDRDGEKEATGRNSILVVFNQETLACNRMYVTLTGTFRAVPANGGHSAVLKDIRSCVPLEKQSQPAASLRRSPTSSSIEHLSYNH